MHSTDWNAWSCSYLEGNEHKEQRRVSEIRFPHFTCLFLSFVNLARFHFLVPWRNEYSVACLTWKLQGLVNLYWTLGLWLQSRKYFLQLGYINASMSLGTITGFRLFFSTPFQLLWNFCVSLLCDWGNGREFASAVSVGRKPWVRVLDARLHGTSKTCFIVLFRGEQPYPVSFFTKTSSRSQLCNRLRLLNLWW